MNKWKIDIILNSGKELTVCYEGPEMNTGAVAEKVLTGSRNSLVGFASEDGAKNVLITVGEIAAASIYAG